MRCCARRLAERKLAIELSDKALEFIVNHGYDPVYGARPLKRAIQRHIQDGLALNILEGKFKEGDTIKIDTDKTAPAWCLKKNNHYSFIHNGGKGYALCRRCFFVCRDTDKPAEWAAHTILTLLSFRLARNLYLCRPHSLQTVLLLLILPPGFPVDEQVLYGSGAAAGYLQNNFALACPHCPVKGRGILLGYVEFLDARCKTPVFASARDEKSAVAVFPVILADKARPVPLFRAGFFIQAGIQLLPALPREQSADAP